MTELEMWVIYEKPLDFPEQFVARKFILDKPTNLRYFGDTLEEIRQTIPEGLTMIPRFHQDDPKIVEVWI